jgi:hypothetical protein
MRGVRLAFFLGKKDLFSVLSTKLEASYNARFQVKA